MPTSDYIETDSIGIMKEKLDSEFNFSLKYVTLKTLLFLTYYIIAPLIFNYIDVAMRIMDGVQLGFSIFIFILVLLYKKFYENSFPVGFCVSEVYAVGFVFSFIIIILYGYPFFILVLFQGENEYLFDILGGFILRFGIQLVYIYISKKILDKGETIEDIRWKIGNINNKIKHNQRIKDLKDIFKHKKICTLIELSNALDIDKTEVLDFILKNRKDLGEIRVIDDKIQIVDEK